MPSWDNIRSPSNTLLGKVVTSLADVFTYRDTGDLVESGANSVKKETLMELLYDTELSTDERSYAIHTLETALRTSPNAASKIMIEGLLVNLKKNQAG